MTNSNDDGAPRPQAVVAGDLDGAGTLNGRAGTSVFSIGGPDGRGGTAAGANPYELLSASLAACTAMTIRLQARRQKIPLSHVEVAVSYHHGGVAAATPSSAPSRSKETLSTTSAPN